MMNRLAYNYRTQVRYRLARRLIHIGLFVMPPGRYKAELLEKLWELYDEVCSLPRPDALQHRVGD